jgi:hypothetical protein
MQKKTSNTYCISGENIKLTKKRRYGDVRRRKNVLFTLTSHAKYI